MSKKETARLAVPGFMNNLWRSSSETLSPSAETENDDEFHYGASSHTMPYPHEQSAADPQTLTSDQVISQLSVQWFDEDFDCVRHTLEQLPQDDTRLFIMTEKQTQTEQLEAIADRLGAELLDKGPVFVHYAQELQQIQLDIQRSQVICSNGRRKLYQQNLSATKMLRVLSLQRQRTYQRQLLNICSVLKVLRKSKARLAHNMALVDYSEAFSLCSDCLKLIGTLRQYNCVVAMEQQLLPLVESIEGELSEFFKSTYRRFDEASYRKVLKVYNRTGHLSRLTKSQPEYCELVIQEISLDTLRATGCGLNTNHKWDKMTYTQVSNALAASDAFASGFIRLCSELYVVMDCYNDVCHMHGVEPHNLQPRTLAQSIDTTGPVAMPTDAIATAPKVANPSTPPHHSAGDDNAIDETSAQPETINEEYIPSPTEQQHSTEGEDKELTDTSTDIRTQTTANHTATSDTDFERKVSVDADDIQRAAQAMIDARASTETLNSEDTPTDTTRNMSRQNSRTKKTKKRKKKRTNNKEKDNDHNNNKDNDNDNNNNNNTDNDNNKDIDKDNNNDNNEEKDRDRARPAEGSEGDATGLVFPDTQSTTDNETSPDKSCHNTPPAHTPNTTHDKNMDNPNTAHDMDNETPLVNGKHPHENSGDGQSHQSETNGGSAIDDIADGVKGVSLDRISQQAEVRDILTQGRLTVWYAVQSRVCAYLNSDSQSFGQASFQFDDFITLLHMTHRCIAVGQVFCGGSGADLYAALSRKSSVFLKNFHKARLEDVKAMIENERWQRIPAQTTFSVNSFREFAFLQDITDHTDDESKEAARWAEVVAVQNSITDGHSPFAVLTDDDRQFRSNTPDTHLSSRRCSSTPIGQRSLSPAKPISKGSTLTTPITMEDFQEKLEEPIICATTLNVVRLIGRYMQVLHAIPNAHDDVFAGVAQLVDYYLFAVYQFFGTPLPARGAAPSGGTLYSSSPSSPTPRTTVPANKFETVLGSEGLSRLLIKMRGMVSSGGMHIAPGQLVATPTIAPSVPISNKQELCGLAARVCGLESLKYIANVLNDLKPTFLAICPSTTLVKLHAFYKETVNQIDDLVAYCYRNIATKLMRYDLPLSEMNAMRWDLHDISTEQHKYVDTTIRQCQQFSDRLTQLGYEKIPPVVQEHVWSQVIRVTMFMFIEGFSSARRCSNEGRAMMMLDLKTFVPVLESLTTLRPIPYVKPVELFIKAFYLPEPALEEWLTESTVYTKRQLETFIRHTATVDQFARTRLLAILSAKK